MEFSKIYLSFSDFTNVERKFAIQENKNEKKTEKIKNFDINQSSFLF